MGQCDELLVSIPWMYVCKKYIIKVAAVAAKSMLV